MKDEESGNRLGSYLRARRELVSPAQAGIPPGGIRWMWQCPRLPWSHQGPPESRTPRYGVGMKDEESGNRLGSYLRARRELVSPAQAGIPPGGNRRVPSLRREEVALLAGISPDYYLRLERGRDKNPSPQVLESLARVLCLDDIERTYLLGLTAARPRAPRRKRPEHVPARVHQLLAHLQIPAFVEGRAFDVLTSNPMAVALSPRLRPGQNRLRSFFLDPEEQAFHQDWDKAAASFVAALRTTIGDDTDTSAWRICRTSWSHWSASPLSTQPVAISTVPENSVQCESRRRAKRGWQCGQRFPGAVVRVNHGGAVRERARDESAGGNSFGPVFAIDAFSRVGDSLECPPRHVDGLLVGESLKFIDEVCGEVAVERAVPHVPMHGS
ncbi:hypothetical protein SALBM311S_04473 [Streptomyces alboniger]